MKKLILYLVLFFITATPFAQTIIEKNTNIKGVWTLENSPYIINGQATIESEDSLIIEKGVKILFSTSNFFAKGRLLVKGILKAKGTKSNPILFTRNGDSGYWSDLSFVKSQKSELDYCEIEHSIGIDYPPYSTINLINSSLVMDNIKINDSKNCAIGIDEKSSAKITNSTVSGSKRNGIILERKSKAVLTNCIIENCQDAGIKVIQHSKLEIYNSNLLYNNYAIEFKGDLLKVFNSIIWGNYSAFTDYDQSSDIRQNIIQKELVKGKTSEKYINLTSQNIIGNPSDYPNITAELMMNKITTYSVNYNNNVAWIGINNSESIKKTPKNSNEKMIASKEEVSITNNNQLHLSDVDINIPKNNNENDYRFALIIGNEDYTKYQTSLASEVNVDFAVNDAEVFAKYCKYTLGIPEDNVFLLKDAIGTEMKREVNKLAKLMMYTQGKAEVIFYYAGHGIPHEVTKESYLMPVDVSAQNMEDGVKLSWVYNKLTEYDAKHVLVFLDACFSGGARNQGLLAARGVKIKPKENIITGNCVAFTSSSDIQSSLPYKEEQHGMFTYHLLKKIQETKGNISLGELSDYLYESVALSSIKVNSKEQTPKTLVSPSLKDSWKQIKLNE